MKTLTLIGHCGYILLIILFAACGNPSQDTNEKPGGLHDNSNELVTQAVVPPFQSLNVAYREFEVDNTKGDIFKMATGTVIRVPKDAFVDPNGKPYEGKVKLKYREFHDAADIIASGIPMVNQNDPDRYMQTAGMMEIRPVDPNIELARSKEIEIEMASYVQGNEYDFFYLEEKNCRWIEKGTSEPKANPVLAQLRKLRESVPPPPTKLEKADKSRFVFNLDINYKAFPELKSFKNVIWQYSGNTDSDNPEKNSWVFKEDWTSIDLQSLDPSKALYSLKLRNGDKLFETVVSPALTGQDYAEALAIFEKKNQDYQARKKAFAEENERVKQEAELLRVFKVDRFGIFNWDIWKKPKRLVCNAKFEFEGDVDTDINKINVFLVSDDERSVIKFTSSSFSKFSFVPSGKNQLIAVLPGNRLAVFSQNEFSKLNVRDLERKSANYEQIIFKLRLIPGSLSSVEDLKLIIGQPG